MYWFTFICINALLKVTISPFPLPSLPPSLPPLSPGTAEVSSGGSKWEVGGKCDRGRSQLQCGTETAHVPGQSLAEEQQHSGSR